MILNWEQRQRCTLLPAEKKSDHPDPYIVLGCDINGHPLEKGLDTYADFKILDSPPTCQDSCLDLAAVFFCGEVTSTETLPPVSSDDESNESDHQILLVSCALQHRHQFTPVCYFKRVVNKAGKSAFHE